MDKKVNEMEEKYYNNCRFCKNAMEFEFEEEAGMDSFKCSYWEKETKITSYVWIWPEMSYFCAKFKPVGVDATRVFELEQEVEALRKELEKFQ